MFNFKILAIASALAGMCSAVGVRPGQIKHIVTFGDSYSDIRTPTGDNGTAWPVLVSEYAKIQLHAFARAGATCSNNITNRPFPSVFESQLPDLLAEQANHSLVLPADETLYTLWIGTNDVGNNALLTCEGNLPKGSTIVDTTACAVNWVKTLYEHGARNFVFQNMIPLQLAPMYSNISYPNKYWNQPINATEWNLFMGELVAGGNEISKLMLQALAPTLHGAHIALFDSHSLFLDMFNNPSQWFNGTAPLNVTGSIRTCIYSIGGANNTCNILTDLAERDSFLWFDELHPSQQSDRNVARQIADIALGKANRFTTWLS